MICGRRTRDGREFLFLGLTEANVQLLREGHPIRLQRETHGESIPAGWTIGIILALNKEELMLKMLDDGLIGPETKLEMP
jgi:hypothetical protein